MLLRAIDFETTDLEGPTTEPEVCEAGWSDISYDTQTTTSIVSDPISMLCNPGVPITPCASGIHHITNADVLDAPLFSAVKAAILDGSPTYFVAHNADFERGYFGTGDTPWIDTWKVALRIWPDAPSHKLQSLRYYLDLTRAKWDIGAAHRAGPDAYLCALLMQRILLEAKFTLADMVRFSDGPALLPRITFGKHRGEKWDEAPANYLEWIVEKSDLDRDIKANARYWLSKRAG